MLRRNDMVDAPDVYRRNSTQMAGALHGRMYSNIPPSSSPLCPSNLSGIIPQYRGHLIILRRVNWPV
jgi:hypothetical protein